MFRVAVTAAAVACAWLGAGCASQGCPNRSEQGRGAAALGPAPTFEAVAARYNERVKHLDRLWARTVVRYEGLDSEDRTIDEQGEGHLQVVRPRKLYFSVGKVGETGFQLGSDDTRYWWIDVQNHTASLGAHAKVTKDWAARSGVPVHPLDLIEVLGATPLEKVEGIRGPSWTDDGARLYLSMPGRWGRRVMFLDSRTFEPREIQLLDSAGRIGVRAELSDYAKVGTDEDDARARLAGRYLVSVPATRSTIRVTLYEPVNKDIKERAFSFEKLTKEYGVQRVRDLDAVGARGSGVGP